METEKKLQILQTVYAAAQVDAVSQYVREGILGSVLAARKASRASTSAQVTALLGVGTPQEVFTRLAEIFGCAAWKILPTAEGFDAVTEVCRMHAIARRTQAPSPCELVCLEPLRGMLEVLDAEAEFIVEETLFDGKSCRVRVILK